jgi:septum formation protein
MNTDRADSGFAIPGKSKIENRKSKTRLVLASASPQRKQILANAGYVFEAADPGDVEDSIAAAYTPEELALAKARAKAAHVAAALGPPYPAVAIGADTIVAVGETSEIVGKPADRQDAVRILQRLSGTRHRVISGLCLWPVTFRTAGSLVKRAPPAPCGQDAGGTENRKSKIPVKTAVATTWVKMHRMTDEQIQAYVDSGESDGKAGAYAIQEGGDRFVESLNGSFLNVVGFPLELFEELLPIALREWGFETCHAQAEI